MSTSLGSNSEPWNSCMPTPKPSIGPVMCQSLRLTIIVPWPVARMVKGAGLKMRFMGLSASGST